MARRKPDPAKQAEIALQHALLWRKSIVRGQPIHRDGGGEQATGGVLIGITYEELQLSERLAAERQRTAGVKRLQSKPRTPRPKR